MIERFQVSGMSCAACQANVTKAVQKLDGVNNVDVSLLGNSMKVDYDENTVDADAIIASVEKLVMALSVKKNLHPQRHLHLYV